MATPRRILLIKPGYSETLDPTESRMPSLGDVFRTTVLLHLYREDRVTWLTSKASVPLLEGNPEIDRILVDDPGTLSSLAEEEFDVLVNLEKIPEFCRLAGRIEARERFGFRWDERAGSSVPLPGAETAFDYAKSLETKRMKPRRWSALLFEILGESWNGEECILGYQPRTQVEFDVAFNTHVGSKWPNKAWPQLSWKLLEAFLLSHGYSVTHQQCLNDLYGYMDWIHSSRLFVSNDSLGVHLALAMRKKMVVLFGPTSGQEIDLMERGRAIFPERPFECMPCFSGTCSEEGRTCMESIHPRTVFFHVRDLLQPSEKERHGEVAIA